MSVGEADVASLSRDARLAFYLDAYNALVVKAVIDRWPIEGVMRVPGFFDRARYRVAGRDLTLNELENDVIRGFAEPRVHFALNCASASCPRLGRTPYPASRTFARGSSARRASSCAARRASIARLGRSTSARSSSGTSATSRAGPAPSWRRASIPTTPRWCATPARA
ncbi:MAG: DUF547 domain-containing protein [Sandaracinaceae bacterium]|nr:DUF547 domain-containing protein [Sandaracinaceae bacterium]